MGGGDAMTLTGPVTVVIPVYDGVDDVVRCVTSVMTHTPATVAGLATAIVVIDDHAPDPRMRTALDDLVAANPSAPITLERHEQNRGFVASVNSAFATSSGDVVLVNADTVVTAGWLDRLAHRAAEPGVATVTPLTNHGSICTLPDPVIDAFDLDGPEPRIDDCGRFVAEHSAALAPEVITGVGFCMYTTRAALDLAGPFDEAAYGLGYGEEVDFCVRATRLGFRHLVEDSTFVWHRGGASFGEERHARMREASTFLRKRYRFFRDANRAERAEDPLLLSFTALEQGLHERNPGRPNVLHILHGPLGVHGGTEKHVEDLIAELSDRFDFTLLHPVESGFVVETIVRTDDGTTHRERHLLPGASRWISGTYDSVADEALANCLDLFAPDAVHIHNFNGHSLAPLATLADFAGPVVVFMHDPYLACPHYSLLYRNRSACGLPTDLATCARCLPETEQMELDQLLDFRAFVTDHLDTVDHWVFASQSAADHFARVYVPDPRSIEIVEHSPTIPDDRWILDDATVLHEPLRVAFVGRGWTKKGLHTVNLLADAVAGTTIEIHHFGPLVEDASPRLRTHGQYDNAVLPELLHLAGTSIVLLPGPTPETYGLAMSEAIIAGIPVVGASYGALGERIRRGGVGWTFDPDEPAELIELIRRLDANRHEILRAASRTASVPFTTTADIANRYAELYRGAVTDEDEVR
jgi:glycosyltransferase involved in cell wall biosynthesis/GT2 family glycosyltransferase